MDSNLKEMLNVDDGDYLRSERRRNLSFVN